MNRVTDSRIALLAIIAVCMILPRSLLAVDFAKLYATVSPSVVTVHTRTITLSEGGMRMAPGIGTGFLVEPDLVMTAAHVVDDVDFVKVKFEDGDSYSAKVITSVKDNDVALIRLEKPNNSAGVVTLGNSDDVSIGSPVFVVGAPYGMAQTLSVGHLSGRMQRGKTSAGTPIEFLQTDTAINPGNSGGPMFNSAGEVIGVVSFILSKSGGFNGIGFAGAINSANKALLESSEYIAGFKGVRLTRSQSQALSVPANGILVQSVTSGSLADDLGLKAGTLSAKLGDQSLVLGGDVILSVDCLGCVEMKGELISRNIARKMSLLQPLQLKIYRNRETMTLSSGIVTTASAVETTQQPVKVAEYTAPVRTAQVTH